MSNPMRKFDDFTPDMNDLSGQIVDCAFQVHKELGPGFLEINYEDALIYEFKQKGLSFERQKVFKIPYKNTILASEFRCDLLVEDKILVELKAVEKIHPVHQAQIYAYLKASKIELGLLINFNVALIKNGIGRYVLRNSETPRLNKE